MDLLGPEQIASAFHHILRLRGALFPKPPRLAFSLIEGAEFVVDAEGWSTEWSDEAELSIFSDCGTLTDLLTGAFDPAHPKGSHIFFWAGDANAWTELARATRPGGTPLQLRVNERKGR